VRWEGLRELVNVDVERLFLLVKSILKITIGGRKNLEELRLHCALVDAEVRLS